MSNSNDRLSMASLCRRANVCSEAVMKPCGKKKTGSGKAAGWPLTSHLRMKATRNMRSATHEPSVLSEAKDTFSQMGGSCGGREGGRGR